MTGPDSTQGAAKSWWQTVPGVLTGIAAVITALTGLVVVLRPANSPSDAGPSGVDRTESVAASNPTAGTASPASEGAAKSVGVVRLPSPSQAKLRKGAMVIDIRAARLEPYNREMRSLVLSLRYTNEGLASANFWVDSFRLLIDGVPRAPVNRLNEVVEAQSAEDGDVVFEVPLGTTSAVLRILAPDERTDMPLEFTDR